MAPMRALARPARKRTARERLRTTRVRREPRFIGYRSRNTGSKNSSGIQSMAFGASRRRAGATPPCAFFLVTVLLSFGGPLSLSGQTAGHGIAAANLKVVQNDQGNTTNSVTVSTTLSINSFAVRDGSNRGDYNVQVGP